MKSKGFKPKVEQLAQVNLEDEEGDGKVSKQREGVKESIEDSEEEEKQGSRINVLKNIGQVGRADIERKYGRVEPPKGTITRMFRDAKETAIARNQVQKRTQADLKETKYALNNRTAYQGGSSTYVYQKASTKRKFTPDQNGNSLGFVDVVEDDQGTNLGN